MILFLPVAFLSVPQIGEWIAFSVAIILIGVIVWLLSISSKNEENALNEGGTTLIYTQPAGTYSFLK